jgi:hypothetical protein
VGAPSSDGSGQHPESAKDADGLVWQFSEFRADDVVVELRCATESPLKRAWLWMPPLSVATSGTAADQGRRQRARGPTTNQRPHVARLPRA